MGGVFLPQFMSQLLGARIKRITSVFVISRYSRVHMYCELQHSAHELNDSLLVKSGLYSFVASKPLSVDPFYMQKYIQGGAIMYIYIYIYM